MRLLVPFVEFVICLLIFKWLVYGYRRKSELTVVFASMLFLFGLFVLASEILIDGFYRELRAGRIGPTGDIIESGASPPEDTTTQ